MLNPGEILKAVTITYGAEGKDWFPRDTWLLFEEPVELSATEFAKAVNENTITVQGQLQR